MDFKGIGAVGKMEKEFFQVERTQNGWLKLFQVRTELDTLLLNLLKNVDVDLVIPTVYNAVVSQRLGGYGHCISAVFVSQCVCVYTLLQCRNYTR